METKFELPGDEIYPNMSLDERQEQMIFNPSDYGYDFELIGRVPKPKSIDIKESPIGIGFETLDRKTFNPKPTYKYLADSGVKWARVQTGWNRCEKKKGKYTFEWLDDIVDNLLRIGIQPWFSVSFGNKLYTPAKEHLQEYVGEVALYYGKEAVTAWKKYVASLAKHFKNRISHWEIWNEPNAGFWRPKPDAADYTRLVKISACEIRKHIKNAQIIGGALSNLPPKFLEDALQAGLAEQIDIFSFHPYGPVPEWKIESQMNIVKQLLGCKRKRIKLWQGECGRPSFVATSTPGLGAKKGVNLTPLSQAKYLTRRIVTDIKYGFDMTSYFAVSDFHDYMLKGNVKYQGILSAKPCAPKMAYFALRNMAVLFDSQTRAEDYYLVVIPPWAHYHNPFIPFVSATTATFSRKGYPMFAYYYPENPDFETDPMRCDLQIWANSKNNIDRPVLIDPVNGAIYKIDFLNLHPESGFKRLRPMPLLNYPLIVTDRNAI